MSFTCERCKKQQPSGQTINFVVTETRQRTYENELKYGKTRGTLQQSTGTEIVKQVKACPVCYKELTGLEPEGIIIPVTAISKTMKVHYEKREEKRWTNPHRTFHRPGRGNRQDNQTTVKQTRPERHGPIVEVVNPVRVVKE